MEQKVNEQQQAQNLYFQTELSNAQIAHLTGVSTRTISRWITKENWKRIKEAARHAPSAIAEKLYFQINEINDHILSRQPGQRFATKDEADIIRKLTISLDKIKEQTTICETIDIMMRFTTQVAKKDIALAQKITLEANAFIKGSPGESQKPYEISYGPENEDPYPEDSFIDTEGQSQEGLQKSVEPFTTKASEGKQEQKTATSLSSKNIQDTKTVRLYPSQDTGYNRQPASQGINPREQAIYDDWQRLVDSLKE